MTFKKSIVKSILRISLLTILGYLMAYPLIWMIFAAFKTNQEIFGSTRLLPRYIAFDAFILGWKGSGQYSYATYYINTFELVLPVVIFTAISSVIVAYGFARFDFTGKRLIFSLMVATMMLPSSTIIIPRYLLFRDFHWLNTYLPFIVPSMFGGAFFVFLLIQFMRGIPKELDEAAYIDGCGPGWILIKIIAPLCKPAIISVIVFQFLWTWDDFFNPLIYITSVSKYTLSLALKMAIDPQVQIAWNQSMAMSLLSIVPCLILFFAAQKYFVEGVVMSGLKA
jgi:oligogalacturonide transport system permease protein